MVQAAQKAPSWAHDLARQINREGARVSPVGVPVYNLADLPDATDYYQSVPGDQRTALIGVNATGGLTICFSDGTNWIDLQTGSAVA